MSEKKLCHKCMEPLEEGSICHACGYDNNSVTLANYLKPGTVLHERYLIGVMLSANGEGVTYIAFDQHVKCKVMVREYFPEQLCTRQSGSTEISVDATHLAQYKALMAEYTELNKALARMRHLSHLNPALDLFAENNTTYAVYEYFEGGTLLSYLKENAGELSWNTVKRIFPPLFTSLSMLHNAGVLHRGLSPETIFVTDRGELKLRGFCISAVRTQDTELDAELFDGYAAPEQYFADRSQGTWTDVYGICAVLYRILTGARATDAISRGDYDNLIPPADVNPQVPDTVSQAIMRGLKLDAGARVRTITDLVTLLFETPVEPEESTPASPEASEQEQRPGSTAVFPAQSGSTRRSSGTAASTGTRAAASRPHGSAPARSHSTAGTRTRSASASGGRAIGYASPHSRAAANEPTLFERIRVPMLIAVLFIVIVALVILVFSQMWEASGTGDGRNNISWHSENIATDSAAGNVTSTQPIGYNAMMPDLVDKDYEIKSKQMSEDGILLMDPTYEFSEEYSRGRIMWQEIEPDQPFVMGSTIKVRVSKGSPIVALPDFKEMKLDQYLTKLEEYGFAKASDGNYAAAAAAITTKRASASSKKTTTTTTTAPPAVPSNVQTAEGGAAQIVYYKEKVDYRYQNGYVCGVEPAIGTPINVKQGYTITVYYANNPFSGGNSQTPAVTTKKPAATTKTTTTTKAGGAALTTKTTTSSTMAAQTTPPTAQTPAPITQAPPPQTPAPTTQPPQPATSKTAAAPPPPPAENNPPAAAE